MKIIKPGFDPQDQEIVISRAEVTYSQCAGSAGAKSDPEELTVVMLDGGGGPYLELKTDQWSIDRPDELVDVLRHFMQLVGMESEIPVSS